MGIPETSSRHKSVLLHEALEGLAIVPDDIVFDGTIGGSGHARAIAELLSEEGILIGVDLDADAILGAKVALQGVRPKVFLLEENFRNLDKVLDSFLIPRVTKVLFDLGLRSDQLEFSGRGFTFKKNEPLLMTFKKNPGSDDLTAWEILNTWEKEAIAELLESYGEERFAKRIASAITERRRLAPIVTTEVLVAVIEESVPYWYRRRKIHCATKTFQALRMGVNDEVAALKEGLAKGVGRLEDHGRIAVITFHSIEDRIVKHFFRESMKEGKGSVITKKAIAPQRKEIIQNPRSRSAHLRVFEKGTQDH